MLAAGVERKCEMNSDSAFLRKFRFTLIFITLFLQNNTLITQKSIAVLPFVNMSNNIENEYFCDGITEEPHLSPLKVKILMLEKLVKN